MIKISKLPLAEGDGDTLVYFVREKKGGAPKVADREVLAYLKTVRTLGDFKGQAGRTLMYYRNRPTTAGSTKARPERVIVVGLGRDEPNLELFREAGGLAAKAAMGTRAVRLRVALPEAVGGLSSAAQAGALVEGLVLGSYRFTKYKKSRQDELEEKEGQLSEIIIHAGDDRDLVREVNRGLIAALAVRGARDMANEPGNHWTPGHFARAGRRLAKEHGLICKVYDQAALKKLGMGGILAVSQGSDQPPNLVALEYRGGRNQDPTLLLVGKGLTFDSGGISLKPGAGMQDMKFDMSGGAAVLAVMQALAELKPAGLHVVALVPASENLLGPAALKPGDIISQYNGKTVEVANTDAEGRLLLADALAFGVKKYQPTAVIDIATLTGAVIVGLGHYRTGLMSNNDSLAAQLLASGERCGEPLWRLPLDREYLKQLKSEVADLRNVGNDRAAGTLAAGCFLQEFVGDTPWAHLDIAGTAWDFIKKSYVPKGPSGVGVRTLLDLILNWQKLQV
jgi:leucyl aminopeptidase